MKVAPIALFTYNRLTHTQLTIDSLKKNEWVAESELVIFSDGPRSRPDEEKVQAVREYLKTVRGFKKTTIVERERNLGLAQSIIAGVSDIVTKHGRIIVLEDDMTTSPGFLRYMNEALEFYSEEDRVISIHGYVYPVVKKLPETFFLKGADCWGWATWKRGWDLFEPDATKLLAELRSRKLTRAFDFDGTTDYTRMLEDRVNGKNNSWAVLWYASAFLRNKLTLYPGRSLVANIGTDASGTHCAPTDRFDTVVSREIVRNLAIPVEESGAARDAFKEYFQASRESTLRKILKRLVVFSGR